MMTNSSLLNEKGPTSQPNHYLLNDECTSEPSDPDSTTFSNPRQPQHEQHAHEPHKHQEQQEQLEQPKANTSSYTSFCFEDDDTDGQAITRTTDYDDDGEEVDDEQERRRMGHISMLDSVIMLHIFSFLSVSDLLNVSEVCHHWRLLASNESLWFHFYHSTPWSKPFTYSRNNPYSQPDYNENSRHDNQQPNFTPDEEYSRDLFIARYLFEKKSQRPISGEDSFSFKAYSPPNYGDADPSSSLTQGQEDQQERTTEAGNYMLDPTSSPTSTLTMAGYPSTSTSTFMTVEYPTPELYDEQDEDEEEEEGEDEECSDRDSVDNDLDLLHLLHSDNFLFDLRKGKLDLIQYMRQPPVISQLLRLAFGEDLQLNHFPTNQRLPEIVFQTISVEAISEVMIASDELLDQHFQFLHTCSSSPPSPHKSSFFARICELLFERYPNELMSYFIEQNNIIPLVVGLVTDQYLMETLFKLVENHHTHNWLTNASLIPLLVQQLASDQPNVSEWTSVVLGNIFSLCSQNPHTPLVVDLFSNIDLIRRLIHFTIDGKDGERVKQGLNVIISILQLLSDDLSLGPMGLANVPLINHHEQPPAYEVPPEESTTTITTTTTTTTNNDDHPTTTTTSADPADSANPADSADQPQSTQDPLQLSGQQQFEQQQLEQLQQQQQPAIVTELIAALPFFVDFLQNPPDAWFGGGMGFSGGHATDNTEPDADADADANADVNASAATNADGTGDSTRDSSSDRNERCSRLMLQTTAYTVNRPFGSTRLRILEFFNVFVNTGYLAVANALATHRAFDVCLDLFFYYKWNNILHHQVTQIISNIFSFESQNSLNLQVLEQLVPRLQAAFGFNKFESTAEPQQEEAQQAEPPQEPQQHQENQRQQQDKEQAGYMGHLIQLANEIVKLCQYSPVVSKFLAENYEWDWFASTSLSDANAREATLIAGGVASLLPQTDYDIINAQLSMSSSSLSSLSSSSSGSSLSSSSMGGLSHNSILRHHALANLHINAPHHDEDEDDDDDDENNHQINTLTGNHIHLDNQEDYDGDDNVNIDEDEDDDPSNSHHPNGQQFFHQLQQHQDLYRHHQLTMQQDQQTYHEYENDGNFDFSRLNLNADSIRDEDDEDVDDIDDYDPQNTSNQPNAYLQYYESPVPPSFYHNQEQPHPPEQQPHSFQQQQSQLDRVPKPSTSS